MFEKTIRELEALHGHHQISIPIKSDKEGYLDRECPNKECLFQFKVFDHDWETFKNKDKVFCPLCGHEAKSSSWATTEQVEEAKEQALKHVLGRIDQAMLQDANDFNRNQSRNSFFKMSIKVSGVKPYHYFLPLASKEEMAMKIQCQKCNVRYSVIGSAFFCPCCGHNSAIETFDNSLRKVEVKIKNLPVIRKAVEAINKDEAETTCRSLIESSLVECVTAFQRFCEVVFSSHAPQKKIKYNAFQNLEMGGEYWKELFDETYTDWLQPNEFNKLVELFQKRHLLSHSEGVVDQKFIDRVSNTKWEVGQRIVVKEKDIQELITLTKRITDKIKNYNI